MSTEITLDLRNLIPTSDKPGDIALLLGRRYFVTLEAHAAINIGNLTASWVTKCWELHPNGKIMFINRHKRTMSGRYRTAAGLKDAVTKGARYEIGVDVYIAIRKANNLFL